MKKATCRDLRGVCDEVITGATPEEMGENSKKHVMEMLAKGDQAHQEAVNEMMALSPEQQQTWFDGFAEGFSDLADA